MEPVLCARLGQVPYGEARALQKRLEQARQAGETPDVLLLLEHPPVYTKGRRTDPGELPMGEEWYRMQGIEIAETDRGGRVTYHGPGQLVAYPIVSLAPYGGDVHLYVRNLERVMIEALAEHGVAASTIAGLTGVWVEQPVAGGAEPSAAGAAPASAPQPVGAEAAGAETEFGFRKIGSIGVHVNRGVTTHGLAVNVNNDLQPFEWIVPCGIDHCLVTSLTREHGAEQDLGAFAETIAERFAQVFGRRLEPVADPEALEAAAVR